RLEQVLELLEGLGNRRLADRQHVGRPGQAALPGNLQETQQVAILDTGIEVHARQLAASHRTLQEQAESFRPPTPPPRPSNAPATRAAPGPGPPGSARFPG